MNILIVRLGALGDVVHAIPAAAALGSAFPDARIDWLVEARHRDIVDLVPVVSRVIAVERGTLPGWLDAVKRLRQMRYDAALDFQGLLKSAILARASGARRVLGFSIWHLREKTARPFYSETADAPNVQRPPRPESAVGDHLDHETHVIRKNLNLLRTLGVDCDRIAFPLAAVESPALDEIRSAVGVGRAFALINPGAAWPNKRWSPERYGEIAVFLQEVRGLAVVVLWGRGEERLAHAVVGASGGGALMAPPTTVRDLVAVSRAAALMVSGDTGPLHVAAAVGTPTVAIFGPTNPERNGPWSAEDVVVSRFDSCRCHYNRRCRQSAWCLDGVTVAEVTAAIQQRLARV